MIIHSHQCVFKGRIYHYIPNTGQLGGGLLLTIEQLLYREIDYPLAEPYYAYVSAHGEMARNGIVIGRMEDLKFVEDLEVLKFMSAGEVEAKASGE